MMQWVFILLGLSSIAGSIALGGGSNFLDLPSALLVLVAGFGFAVAFHGVGATFAALRAGCRDVALPDEDTDFHAIVLQTLRNSLCAAGAAGFMIGLVRMLQNLSDTSQVGPAMAAAALSALYAIVLSEIVVAPMVNRLRIRSEVVAQAGTSSDAVTEA